MSTKTATPWWRRQPNRSLNPSTWMMAVGGLLHIVGTLASVPLARTGPDFGAYYLAAWAVRLGHPIYPWHSVIDLASSAGMPVASFATAYRYPPSTMFGLVPLTLLSYDTARWVWIALLALGVVAVAVMLARMYRRPTF